MSIYGTGVLATIIAGTIISYLQLAVCCGCLFHVTKLAYAGLITMGFAVQVSQRAW